MSTLTAAMLAATTADGISPRVMLLLIGSIIVALVGGALSFIASAGTHNQRLAAGVIVGFIAFAGAYSFLNEIVVAATPFTPAPGPTQTSNTQTPATYPE